MTTKYLYELGFINFDHARSPSILTVWSYCVTATFPYYECSNFQRLLDPNCVQCLTLFFYHELVSE